MEQQIFYKRGKGFKTTSLAAYQLDEGYKLHYLTFNRTRITKEQRLSGCKAQRVKTLDEEFFFKNLSEIDVGILPHEELTKYFLKQMGVIDGF